MTTITATVRNGRIEPDEPLELPEGTALRITVPNEEELSEEEDATNPASIARDLAIMRTFEPLQMTEEEIAAWEADRKAHKEWELAHFEEHSRKLEQIWE